MVRLSVAAAGSAEKGVNLINARFQAEALRRLRGYDCGVLDNSFFTPTSPQGASRTANADFMWKLTATRVTDIAIGRGMATAYGFDIQSEETVHLSATPPASGTAYLFVYLEWDFNNPDEAVGKIDIRNNGTGSSWTPTLQDNLITNPIGTYQMPLYRLTVNSAGAITATANWASLGITTIGNPLRADYANNADYATKAKDYDTTSGAIKDKFNNIDERLEKLGFREGSITNTSGSTTDSYGYKYGTVKRQGNYVILTLISPTIYYSGQTYNVPVGFRPASEKVLSIIKWYDTTIGTAKLSPSGVLSLTGNELENKYGAKSPLGVWGGENAPICFGYEAAPL